jgi:hypothetical protein
MQQVGAVSSRQFRYYVASKLITQVVVGELSTKRKYCLLMTEILEAIL